MSEMQPTRREVLKKAMYVTPVILTLPAMASFASHGSGRGDDDGDDNSQGNEDKKDKKPK